MEASKRRLCLSQAMKVRIAEKKWFAGHLTADVPAVEQLTAFINNMRTHTTMSDDILQY